MTFTGYLLHCMVCGCDYYDSRLTEECEDCWEWYRDLARDYCKRHGSLPWRYLPRKSRMGGRRVAN